MASLPEPLVATLSLSRLIFCILVLAVCGFIFVLYLWVTAHPFPMKLILSIVFFPFFGLGFMELLRHFSMIGKEILRIDEAGITCLPFSEDLIPWKSVDAITVRQVKLTKYVVFHIETQCYKLLRKHIFIIIGQVIDSIFKKPDLQIGGFLMEVRHQDVLDRSRQFWEAAKHGT